MAAYDDLSRAVWRTSSRSNGGEACVEVAAVWRKSSHSGNGGDCVEVAAVDRRVAVRDSKDPEGPKLVFGARAWETFVKSVQVPTPTR